MRSLNHVTVLGYLGADPDVRHAANGDVVAHLRIATTRRFGKVGGETREETEWHRVVLFRRIAEIAKERLKKGDACLVTGRLKTRTWAKNGVERQTTEIVGEELIVLASREDAAHPAAEPVTAAVDATRETKTPTPRERAMSVLADIADDIPF